MYRRIAISVTVLLGIALGACPLQADIIVGAPGDPGVGDCFPFGCPQLDSFSNAIPSDYQEIFDSSLFPGPITITGLTFFLNNFDNTDPITGAPIVSDTIYPANYTITLSIAAIAVDGLDPLLENNIDPTTAQTFYVGTPGDPNPGDTQFTIPGIPFLYDPSVGNLLMDISMVPNDPTNITSTMFPDVNSSSGGLFSSGFDSDPHPSGCPDGSAGVTTGCTNSDYGLVVGLDTPAIPAAPEPATVWLGLGVLGAIALKRRRSRA